VFASFLAEQVVCSILISSEGFSKRPFIGIENLVLQLHANLNIKDIFRYQNTQTKDFAICQRKM